MRSPNAPSQARGHAAKPFETTEEALRQLAVFIQMSIIGSLFGAVAAQRDRRLSAHGMDAYHHASASHPLSPMTVSGHRPSISTGLRLASRQYPAQRIAQRIHRGMNLVLSPPRERLGGLLFLGAGSVLAGPNHRAVDEQRLQIRIIAGRRDDPLPHAFLAPARGARIRRMPIAQRRIQIAPRTARARNPQRRFDKQTVIDCVWALSSSIIYAIVINNIRSLVPETLRHY